MANNTTGFTELSKLLAIPGKVYALHGSTSGIPSGRRSGIVGGGHRLLADVDAITRVLLISSVMLVMIGKFSIAPSKQWLTELALNTMAFRTR